MADSCWNMLFILIDLLLNSGGRLSTLLGSVTLLIQVLDHFFHVIYHIVSVDHALVSHPNQVGFCLPNDRNFLHTLPLMGRSMIKLIPLLIPLLRETSIWRVKEFLLRHFIHFLFNEGTWVFILTYGGNWTWSIGTLLTNNGGRGSLAFVTNDTVFEVVLHMSDVFTQNAS